MKNYVNGVDWSYYNQFDAISDRYLPAWGEGETKATQIVTAVTKLVYKWYNDGDVFDNVHTVMGGGCNNLSSYANWLYKVCGYSTDCDEILVRISECATDADYEHLLKDLTDALFDPEWLEMQDKQSKLGSIYECEGPFEFDEHFEEDEYDDYYDEESEEEW